MRNHENNHFLVTFEDSYLLFKFRQSFLKSAIKLSLDQNQIKGQIG